MTMSETPQTQTPITAPPISTERLVTVTEAAGQKVLELRSREGKENARLRLFVKSRWLLRLQLRPGLRRSPGR